jgi:hypothetical protein
VRLHSRIPLLQCGAKNGTRDMLMPTSLISSLKSFAAVYRPHMAPDYHTPPDNAGQTANLFSFVRHDGKPFLWQVTLPLCEWKQNLHRTPDVVPCAR